MVHMAAIKVLEAKGEELSSGQNRVSKSLSTKKSHHREDGAVNCIWKKYYDEFLKYLMHVCIIHGNFYTYCIDILQEKIRTIATHEHSTSITKTA
jgi:hypothetical protein